MSVQAWLDKKRLRIAQLNMTHGFPCTLLHLVYIPDVKQSVIDAPLSLDGNNNDCNGHLHPSSVMNRDGGKW